MSFGSGTTAFDALLDQGWFASRLIDYLDSASDALSFASTRRSARVVRLLPPMHLDETGGTWAGRPSGYGQFKWQRLADDRPESLRPHTVILRCRWKGRFRGRPGGELLIIPDDAGDEASSGGLAGIGWVAVGDGAVATLGHAPLEEEAAKLAFRPDADDWRRQRRYRILVRVGMFLRVKDLCVREIVFVDNEAAREALHEILAGPRRYQPLCYEIEENLCTVRTRR